MKLKKRELKAKIQSREDMGTSPERRKFAGSQKSGIPTGSRTLNLLRARQGFAPRSGFQIAPRRELYPDYEGPQNIGLGGNAPDERS